MGGAFKGDRGSLGHITEVECAQIRPPIGRVKCLDAGPISVEKAARQVNTEGYKVLTPRNPRRATLRQGQKTWSDDLKEK